MRFNLSGGSLPLLTTKKMFTRATIVELLWYLRGETTTDYLHEHDVHIWDEWADEDGNLGPLYGYQWRKWPGPNGPVDQVARVVDMLKTNPTDRRMIISAWNVPYLEQMGLPPCHAFFHVWANNGKLKSHLYQRSCDVGLGVPFNIVQYSMLTHMLAHVTGHEAVEFVWTGGDTHIYTNHVEALKEQLLRAPMPSPTLELSESVTDIDSFRFEDFTIDGYKSHPAIKMNVSV